MRNALLKYEQGPIRPPSEAFSLLIRFNRNCPWNRCLFCPVYKGEKYSRRSMEEIKQDIRALAGAVDYLRKISRQHGFGGEITREIIALVGDKDPELYRLAIWLFRGAGSVFLQDGDSLALPAGELVELLQMLKRMVPGITRITTYARSRTLLKKTPQELAQLGQAGLSRVHTGLESGCDRVLAFMEKGVTGEEQVEAGRRVKEAGISLSEYVLLGLGGRQMWRDHALDTAEVLNRINPDFIRVRTLAIHPLSPLAQKVEQGEFEPLDDEGVLREEKLLLEHLQDVESEFVSDHFLNLLEDLAGTLPADRGKMIGRIDQYFSLPPQRRELFRLGRRTGAFRLPEDLDDPAAAAWVERLYSRLQEQGVTVDAYIRQVISANL